MLASTKQERLKCTNYFPILSLGNFEFLNFSLAKESRDIGLVDIKEKTKEYVAFG